MKTLNVFLIALVIVILVSLLSVWFIPSFQDFMAGNRMWNGVRDFIETYEAKTIGSLDDLSGSPENMSIITVPYLEYTGEDCSKLEQFVEQGGTLIIMDDFGFGNNILEYFGLDVRFSGKPLLDPLFCYKNQAFPKITDFSPDISKEGVDIVVLNHATVLQNTDNAEVLAWSSPSSFLDLNENGNWNVIEPRGPFPVAAKIRTGKGTIILASDPSIVIDSMVKRDDNHTFISSMVNPGGEGKKMQFDISHLTQTPLDVSKAGLDIVRNVLSGPYSSLGIIFIAFIAVSRFILRIGG